MTELYTLLKDNNMILDEKEFHELIRLAQIKVNDKIILDSSYKNENIKKLQVGILQKNI